MIRNALIAGATGLVGNELISLLVKTEYYNSIHVIARRPYDLEHLKITSHTIDFERIGSFKPNAFIHDIFICLGTTMKKAGSREAFRKVDYDYVVELAKWAHGNKAERLSVISSVGANSSSGNFYLQTKGQMEEALLKLHLPHLIILRPSLLLGKRKEFRIGESMGAIFMQPLSYLMIGKMNKYRPIQARKVAHALFYHTIHATEATQIIENDMLSDFSYGKKQ
jgi:uncharacterized protein YbjT (DUF2867 family)